MVNELSLTGSPLSNLDDVSTPPSIGEEIRNFSPTSSVDHPDNGVTPHLLKRSSTPRLTPLPSVASTTDSDKILPI